MGSLRRAALTLTLGMILAAIVHLTAVMGVPWLGRSSAYQRIAQVVPAGTTVLLGSDDAAARPRFADPTVEISTCPFDLSDSGYRVSVVTRDLVQSLSIHAERGGVVYAVSDRSASRGTITLTLLTRRQLQVLQANEEETPVGEVRVPVDTVRGLVVVRAHAPFDSLRDEARALVSSLSCQPMR